MKRREFLRKLKDAGIQGCIGGTCLVGLFKASKVFGKTGMILNDKPSGKWHHFVCNKVGDIEIFYMDGKQVTSVILDDDFSIYIEKYRKTTVGDRSIEEYWFRLEGQTYLR